MSRSDRTLTDMLLTPRRPEETYRHSATTTNIMHSARKQSISELEAGTDLTENFRTANTKSRSLVYYDYYNKEQQSKPLFTKIIEGWQNDWYVIKNEFTKCNSFWQWLGLWKARNVQVASDCFDLGRRFHSIPPIGSVCRSCDLINGGIMLALWGRIRYCQNNNMTIWRRPSAYLARPVLLIFGVHQVLMQSSTLDVAIKFNYQTWQDPVLMQQPLVAQWIENKMIAGIDGPMMDNVVPEVFKENQEDNKRNITVPETYEGKMDWEQMKEDGKKYEEFLRETKSLKDLELKDKEDGFINYFFTEQSKQDRYKQAYNILKDKEAGKHLEDMRARERQGIPEPNSPHDSARLASLPPLEPQK